MRRFSLNGSGSILSLLGIMTLLSLVGCADFFPPVNKTGTGTGTGGTGAGNFANDYVYIANQGQSQVTGYAVAKNNSLANLGASALPSGFFASSIAVTRSNTFVYVGGALGIVGYSIGTTGALTPVLNGAALVTQNVTSLDTSPDGKWLFALDATTFVIDLYAINATTGQLVLQSMGGAFVMPTATATVVPIQVVSSPQGNYVAAALGTAGFVVFPFTTATGLFGKPVQLYFTTQTQSNNGVVIDATDTYLYLSQTGTLNGAATNGVYSYNLANLFASPGTATPTAKLAPADAGAGPIVLSQSGTYLYVANRNAQNISGFSVANGVPTLLASSPYTGSVTLTPHSLAVDNSGTYLFAGTLGAISDLSEYSYDATTAGKLDVQATASTGNDTIGGVIATTH